LAFLTERGEADVNPHTLIKEIVQFETKFDKKQWDKILQILVKQLHKKLFVLVEKNWRKDS
jgi:hypothetical protein